ncbi:uncharacterized protein LOC129234240 [Uloborus diversus]|uniref:uncharacterized protein LOC129234240 n=1 Tax=Uloborus diversus TaxID=327109 RepID=UPI00240A1759|nr:uncharacterized protein LOC129234240 [Uloborus diversus]
MYSDNGSNFTGTARALQSLNWEEIQSECALQNIKWHFSPPTAPWYGGWWERMVRSIKQILRKCLGKACVTYEEMLTVLCEAESVINERPLTYISDDPNEMTPVTPAHFIQDIRGSETHDLDILDSQHLLKRVRYVQSLRDNFRKRFQKEYLGELVRNPKSRSKQQEISVGEIVLIGCEDTKRLNWPLGRVVELYPGRDGIQRIAKLRVANGYLVRPLQRLYPLEMSISDLPSDLAANGKEVAANIDSGYLESTAVPIPKTLNPDIEIFIPMTEVPQPVKQTRSGRRIVPPQRLDL